jgi:hypothetical protein
MMQVWRKQNEGAWFSKHPSGGRRMFISSSSISKALTAEKQEHTIAIFPDGAIAGTLPPATIPGKFSIHKVPRGQGAPNLFNVLQAGPCRLTR